MNPQFKNIVANFTKYCQKELNIERLPKIQLIGDKNWVATYRSFGEYNPGTNNIKVFYKDRNTADILRSLAHELVHHRQEELGMIQAVSGDTGSEIENEANALAGVLLRDYGKEHIEIYDLNYHPLNETIKIDLYPGKKGVYVKSSDKDIKNASKVQIPLNKLLRNEPALKMKSPESIENIKSLASVYRKGDIMDPILVRKKGDKFQILDGHHRYTAAKLAGVEDISAIIVPDKDITPVNDKGSPLNEVGEVQNPYPWKYNFADDDGNIFYSFETPQNKYSVGITDNGDNSYEMLFNTEGEMGYDTGEGVALKVLSTVFDIANAFVKKYEPDDFIIRPTEEKRARIYKAYAQKNLPSGYKLVSMGDTHHWIKPKK